MPTRNIKIIMPTFEHPEEKLGNGIVLPKCLHVEIEIDGLPWTLAGLPGDYTREDILKFAENDVEDLYRQATHRPVRDKIRERTDLLDEPPRNLEAEIDDMKQRLVVVESKRE